MTKEQAVATLQQGRREISAEARWIQYQLSPTHLAERLMGKRPLTMIGVAAGLGMVTAVVLLHVIDSKVRRSARPRTRKVELELDDYDWEKIRSMN